MQHESVYKVSCISKKIGDLNLIYQWPSNCCVYWEENTRNKAVKICETFFRKWAGFSKKPMLWDKIGQWFSCSLHFKTAEYLTLIGQKGRWNWENKNVILSNIPELWVLSDMQLLLCLCWWMLSFILKGLCRTIQVRNERWLIMMFLTLKLLHTHAHAHPHNLPP